MGCTRRGLLTTFEGGAFKRQYSKLYTSKPWGQEELLAAGVNRPDLSLSSPSVFGPRRPRLGRSRRGFSFGPSAIGHVVQSDPLEWRLLRFREKPRRWLPRPTSALWSSRCRRV